MHLSGLCHPVHVVEHRLPPSSSSGRPKLAIGPSHDLPASIRGEELFRARDIAHGVEGDRIRTLVVAETRRIVSAKHPRKWGEALNLAEAHGDFVAITLPDGEVVSSRDAGIDETFSACRRSSFSGAPSPRQRW